MMFIYTSIGLCIVGITLYLLTHSVVPVTADADFKMFQWTYLPVYLLAMVADWLQGPYMYALYAKYEMTTLQIQQLFVAGFGASMIFGTFVGSVADKYGRRNNCILYCILYGLSCVTKHFADFYILMVGRLLGGIATSLLFSAFEAWLVCEHKRRSFPDDHLTSVFALQTSGSSVVAILSGVIAQAFSDVYGMVAPFDLSLVILIILCIVIITTWTENYGDSTASVLSSFTSAISAIKNDRIVLYLGLVQALFEGAMYTFVLEWTPALEFAQPFDPNHKADEPLIPHGWIFTSFMVSVMIGSSLFKLLNKVVSVESFMRIILFVAMVSLSAPIFLPLNQRVVYLGFLIFEACIGVFWPALMEMRKKYLPEEARATIMNFYRIPLNLLVIIILLQDFTMSSIFKSCCLFLFVAFLSQCLLYRTLPSNGHYPKSSGASEIKVPVIPYTDEPTNDEETNKHVYIKM